MSLTEPRGVSVIIPVYNHAGSLPRAVDSVLCRAALREVIIVDDCSTDDSLAVASELARQDARLRVVRTAVNSGPAAARNLGVSTAAGSQICFLDADDELIADFFAEALDLMATHPDMRVVKAEQEYYDPVKGYILPESDPRHGAAVLSSSTGMVLDVGVFRTIGGFPEDPVFRGPSGGEDVAFMQALIRHFQPMGKIARAGTRVWSSSGSHVDRFLATTRLSGAGFEFVRLTPDQQPGSTLAQALDKYLSDIARRFAPLPSDSFPTLC